MANDAYQGTITPPLTDKKSSMQPAPLMAKLKKIGLIFLGAIFIGGLVWGAGEVFEIGWLRITGYVLGGLVTILAVSNGLTAKVADCPYCGGVVGATAENTISAGDEKEQVECDHCHEWLISHQGIVRAFTEKDGRKMKKFQAPVFEDGRWPDECIVCGQGITRTEKAKKSKVELSKLLIGSLSVASGSINGIPYCDNHSEAVGVDMEDDYLRLVFPSLAMQRRYLAANAHGERKPIKSK